MSTSVAIFGRSPALSLAELESLYGSSKVRPIGTSAAIVDVDTCLFAYDRLGGSTKFCKLLTILDTGNWKQIEKFLISTSPAQSELMPEGKMHLGLSGIGFDITVAKLSATALNIKKAIRTTGRSVRVVPNNEHELSSAQVIHNKLTTDNGWELVLIKDNDKTIVAQTVKVQDIESYTRRDRGRPRRDAKVGMLPPKLAQTIINLAVGLLPEEAREASCSSDRSLQIPAEHFVSKYILDPFCGTGVVLQEASLMGYDVQGSDLDPRMVDYTDKNLLWLLSQPENKITPQTEDNRYYKLEVGDATSHTWQPMSNVVACESYLGRPFTTRPSDEILNQTVSECNLIIKKFLKNIHGQLKSGDRLCIAVPAWQSGPGIYKHLPLVDQIEDLGYNRVSFEHVSRRDLIYSREDQIVARELLVITRK